MWFLKKQNNPLVILFVVFSISATVSLYAAKPESVWQESINYEVKKQYASAARVLEPMLVTSSNDQFLLIRLGWLNYLQAHYNKSFDFYKKAQLLNANSIDALLGLTLPLLAQHRWKEAALYAKQVIAMSPWDYVANVRLMTSESALLQWDVLEKHAMGMVIHYPSDPTSYVFLARAQAWLGKIPKAIENYKQVLERAPKNEEALAYLSKHH